MSALTEYPEYDEIDAGSSEDQLRISTATLSLTGGGAGSVESMYRDYTICSHCNERKTLRICFECSYPDGRQQPFSPYRVTSPGKSPARNERSMPVPYCFPCFATVHSNDPARINHRFKGRLLMEFLSSLHLDFCCDLSVSLSVSLSLYLYLCLSLSLCVCVSLCSLSLSPSDLENHDVKHLKCCECNELATRKCLGILDDKEVDEICGKLQRAPAENWKKILQESNIGGDRRLVMLLDQLTEEPDVRASTPSIPVSNPTPIHLSAHQLQHIRMLLERTRAECDECYCDRCYKDIHQGGKRAHHRSVSLFVLLASLRSHESHCLSLPLSLCFSPSVSLSLSPTLSRALSHSHSLHLFLSLSLLTPLLPCLVLSLADGLVSILRLPSVQSVNIPLVSSLALNVPLQFIVNLVQKSFITKEGKESTSSLLSKRITLCSLLLLLSMVIAHTVIVVLRQTFVHIVNITSVLHVMNVNISALVQITHSMLIV
jgi:hypothetical protein